MPLTFAEHSLDYISLVPFKSTIYQIRIGHFTPIIYNIFAFALLIILLKLSKIKYSIAIVAAFSLLIEVLQFVFLLGAADIDNVIFRLVGIYTGLLIFTIGKKLYSKFTSKFKISLEKKPA
jgi:glycopeptide antibiotics resistance protein